MMSFHDENGMVNKLEMVSIDDFEIYIMTFGETKIVCLPEQGTASNWIREPQTSKQVEASSCLQCCGVRLYLEWLKGGR